MRRRPIIRNRRFYWQYEDGRLSPVSLTESQLAHLRQASYHQQLAQQRADRRANAS